MYKFNKTPIILTDSIWFIFDIRLSQNIVITNSARNVFVVSKCTEFYKYGFFPMQVGFLDIFTSHFLCKIKKKNIGPLSFGAI